MQNNNITLNYESLTTEQKKIWRSESQYWHNLAKCNIDDLLSVCHPNAHAWPHWSERIINKIDLENFLNQNMVVKDKSSIKLILQKINVINHSALVFGLAYPKLVLQKDEVIRNTIDCFVHSWIYIDSNWLLFGGMSRPLSETEFNDWKSS